MANQADLLNVLRGLYSRGQQRVRAGAVAELLWPDARTHNANGQVFPLGAGVAGRMLKAEHLLDYMVEPQRSAASVLMQAHGLRGY